jgi:hypothetical protein
LKHIQETLHNGNNNNNGSNNSDNENNNGDYDNNGNNNLAKLSANNNYDGMKCDNSISNNNSNNLQRHKLLPNGCCDGCSGRDRRCNRCKERNSSIGNANNMMDIDDNNVNISSNFKISTNIINSSNSNNGRYQSYENDQYSAINEFQEITRRSIEGGCYQRNPSNVNNRNDSRIMAN